MEGRAAVYEDIGKLILRLTLGILIVFHGVAKLRYGVGGVEDLLRSHGLPTLLAYGAFVGELLAPLLVILGLYARIGALFIALHMIVAFALAHGSQLGNFDPGGGWALELQGMFLFTAVAIALIGPGRFSIDRS
jgi:putative oxidoreductase